MALSQLQQQQAEAQANHVIRLYPSVSIFVPVSIMPPVGSRSLVAAAFLSANQSALPVVNIVMPLLPPLQHVHYSATNLVICSVCSATQ